MRNEELGTRNKGRDEKLVPSSQFLVPTKKLWGGRFEKSTDEMINEFQASINFDKRMYREDIEGSIAHAKMLEAQKIISDDDAQKICAGLEKILAAEVASKLGEKFSLGKVFAAGVEVEKLT